MALLWMDGFEMGDHAVRYTTIGAGVTTSTTGTRFSYGRSITSNTGGNTVVQRVFSAQVTRMLLGFAFFSSGGNDSNEILALLGDAGATSHLFFKSMVNGAIQVYRGNLSTLIASSAVGAVAANVWSYVEISATISDTTGNVQVRLNGTEVINFTGDTRNAGTLQSLDTVSVRQHSTTSQARFDDLYVCDDTGPAPWNTFLGDVRVVTLSPTGPGNSTGLTPSVAPNWGCVDEQPYSATDFVSSAVAGTKDTYACADLPAGSTTVYGVQLNTIAKKSDAGARSLKNVVRSGGVDYSDSVAQVMATSDNSYRTLRSVDPSTSAAWTPAAVNAMEIGVEVA